MKNAIVGLGLAATVAGLLTFGGCNSNSTSPYSNNGTNQGNTPNPSQNAVVIYNMTFSPSTLTVTKGTTITWQNNDGVAHAPTSDTGAWDAGSIPPGGNKSVTFGTAGTFPYHCAVHPMMTGTIVVQ